VKLFGGGHNGVFEDHVGCVCIVLWFGFRMMNDRLYGIVDYACYANNGDNTDAVENEHRPGLWIFKSITERDGEENDQNSFHNFTFLNSVMIESAIFLRKKQIKEKKPKRWFQ
jgi:hypothetical protein